MVCTHKNEFYITHERVEREGEREIKRERKREKEESNIHQSISKTRAARFLKKHAAQTNFKEIKKRGQELL